MKYALPILLLMITACGGGTVTHQNQAPQTPAKPNAADTAGTAGTTGSSKPAPKGPSLAAQYADAVKAAEAAVRALRESPTSDNYAIAGARCYDVKRIEIEHKNNGQDLALLRQRNSFNSNTWIAWKKDLYGRVPLKDRQSEAYKQHPEYVAAHKAYEEVAGDE